MKVKLLILLLLVISNISFAQNDTTPKQDDNTYRIIKTDGGELVGKIIKQDAREILFLTEDNRQIYIPQHTIKELIPLDKKDFNESGEYVGEDQFATRYFLTTNGLPIKKGESYVQWNLYGPDIQFGLGNNVGIGLMTSWLGVPIVATIKKSWELGENTQLAVGGLFGTLSWAAPDWGGALPFATISFGDRRKNVAFSAGYGAIFYDGQSEGRAMSGVAGMVKVSNKVSLVLDSFILLPGQSDSSADPYSERNNSLFALIIPGIRFHQGEGKAFQFGFSGVVANGELLAVPIPMIQWYRSF